MNLSLLCLLVHSGADWELSKPVTENTVISCADTPFGTMGFLLSVAFSFGMPKYGSSKEIEEYQIIGFTGASNNKNV